MLSEYHNYVFTCLDLATLDLEDFQYSGTNISAFSLIDSNAAEYMDVIRDWNQSPSTGIQMPSREITMANRNSPPIIPTGSQMTLPTNRCRISRPKSPHV